MKAKFRQKWAVLILLMMCMSSLSVQSVQGQGAEKKYDFRGYMKDLRSVFFFDRLDNMILHNTLHNRLNFKWYPHENWTFDIEMRNQVFYGGLLKAVNQFQPLISYAQLIEPDRRRLVDMSWNVLDRKSMLIQTQIDRLWLEWVKGDFQIRVGRQRINWGQNWVWNPNDLFNAYSYLDFDYEERPGTDAVHLLYYIGATSQLEAAFAPARDMKASIAAMLFKFNKWNYDFQFIGGYFQHEIAAGFGWAGNIKNGGIKGELTYFHPINDFGDGLGALSVAFGGDYAFQKGLIIQGEFLFNSSAVDDGTGLNFLSAVEQNAKNLFPFRYAFFVGSTYPVLPILNVSFGGIINPEDGTFYLSPAIDWSLKENLDLLVNAQISKKTEVPLFGDFSSIVSTRLKWSF